MATDKDQPREQWLNYLALTTVILAVSATLATFSIGKASTRSLRHEIKAADQWNYYQAKKIRGYMLEVQKENLETVLEVIGDSLSAQVLEKIQKQIAAYAGKMKKWEQDRDTIETDARAAEQLRDVAQRHSEAFGLSVVFLQIGILLSAVAALMKMKSVWIVGTIVGVVGMVYFANGFYLFL